MNPKIAGEGHSFKGAFLYYLNDKRADPSQPHLTTSERVAWTETRNLATDSPHVAWRIMRATHAEAGELKRAAGIKNSGRKATGGPVFSYSLSWEPDAAATLTREEMAAFADRSIKALKADHLQAVVICHTDTAHPHVHVIINRVDPATGKTHSFGQSKNKLSDLAAAYELERGKIVTPKRQDAAKAREEARKRPQPENGPSASWAKRKREQQQAAKSPRIDGEQPKPVSRTDTPASRLKALGDAQKVRHAAERDELWQSNRARRAAIYETANAMDRERAAALRAESRPYRAALYRQQKREARDYEARDRRILGKLRNAIDAVNHRQSKGGGDRGFMTMVMGYLASRDARRAEFIARQRDEMERAQRNMRERLATDRGQIREGRDRALAKDRAAFMKAAADLKTRQAREAAEIRTAWKAIYAERERTAKTWRERSAIRLQGKEARRESRAAWSDELTRRTHLGDEITTLREIRLRRDEAAARKDAAARSTAANEARNAPQQEPQPVKNDHDKARDPRPPAPPVPNRTEVLARPHPAPAPAGAVPAVKRAASPVPAIDKAEAWAKRQQQPQQAAPPQIRREWKSRATPPEDKPAPKREWPSRKVEQPQDPSPRMQEWRSRAAPPQQAEPTPSREWTSRTATARHDSPSPDVSDDHDHDIN